MDSSIDFTSTDRFIPLRRSASECFQVCNSYLNPLNVSCTEYSKNNRTDDSGLNYMQQLYRKNQYNNLLINKIFTSPRRVLYFSPKQKANQYMLSDSIECEDNWPVIARRKPLITSPDLVLDMPDIGVYVGEGSNQRVDWGATGYIAAIHRNSIYTHNPDTNARIMIKSKEILGECIKWNKDGSQIAFALQKKTIGMWDMVSEKMAMTWRLSLTKISAIVFSSRLLITGHTDGMILMWTHNLELIKKINNAHSEIILTMKVSCNESYLASAATDGFVRIWNLSNLNEIFQIICLPSPIRCLDWHPWKEPILILGKTNNNSFCTMWNINQPSDLVTDEHPNDPKVDCLTFNPLSGELVISFWLFSPEETQLRQNIVVQRNLNKVVDDINFHKTRTPYLLWDKNGNRLASVGADENLAIWDFFGQESKKNVKVNLFPKDNSILNATIR